MTIPFFGPEPDWAQEEADRRAALADLSEYDHASHAVLFGSDPYELPDDAPPEAVAAYQKARSVYPDPIQFGSNATSSALIVETDDATQRNCALTGQHTIALDLDFPVQVASGGGKTLVGLDYMNATGTRCAQGLVVLANTIVRLGIGHTFLHTPRGVVFETPHRTRWVESSTPGHGHLYMDAILWWDEYEALLEAFAWAGLVEPGYVGASKRREATHLRLPWVRKAEPHEPIDCNLGCAEHAPEPF